MSKKKEHQHEEKNPHENPEAAADTSQATATDSAAGNEEAAPQAEPSADETIAGLREEVRQAGDRYLRLMAEFDNYKKRTMREYQQMIEQANEKLMTELIHVRNTFELALKHGESSTDYVQLFEGIKLIFQKFDGVLTANGLTAFGVAGDPFDPQLHDALMKTPHAEIPEDHIADIYEKGYRLKERVIKHARVIVSSGKPATPETSA
jgi:molecular chaperone GrpE